MDYTPVRADVGQTLKVQVTFTDDADNEESLTSPATAAVTAPPLTATLHSVAASHDGSTEFTFELHFSEEFELSYTVLRDDAFNVTGGTITKATRVKKGFNIKREIQVKPDGNGDVTIVLPVTTDCAAEGPSAPRTDDPSPPGWSWSSPGREARSRAPEGRFPGSSKEPNRTP